MIQKCRKCEKQYKCHAKADIKEDCKKFKAINKKYLVSVITLDTRETEKFFTNRKPQIPFDAPTKEEVQTYCDEKGLCNTDADEFMNYYESVGWIAGKKPMRDWKAAARNWDKRQQKFDKEKQSKTAKDHIGGQASYNINRIQNDAMQNTTIRGL